MKYITSWYPVYDRKRLKQKQKFENILLWFLEAVQIKVLRCVSAVGLDFFFLFFFAVALSAGLYIIYYRIYCGYKLKDAFFRREKRLGISTSYL